MIKYYAKGINSTNKINDIPKPVKGIRINSKHMLNYKLLGEEVTELQDRLQFHHVVHLLHHTLTGLLITLLIVIIIILMFKERFKIVFKVKIAITMESMKRLMQKDEFGNSAKPKFYPHTRNEDVPT